MKLENKNILKIIQAKIDTVKNEIDCNDYGIVIECADGIAKVLGLNNCSLYDEVFICEEKENNNIGMIMKIDLDITYVIFFKKLSIQQNAKVMCTKRKVSIKIDETLLGKIINPLGEVLLEDEENNCLYETKISFQSASIIERSKVYQPLQTGIQLIDTLIPIGLGQKQLILGDKQTGKTAICLDTIINQANLKANNQEFAYCIYIAIGKKASEIIKIYNLLKEKNAMENTIIIATTASDAASMQYISTDAGATIANYFCSQNKNALIIFDDLTKHAEAYREISLLMRKTPTRGAYPGDIFYLHAKLLEKATKMKTGGSITMLPIIETLEGDISDYIPTNIISITDGQIYMDKELFLNQQKPAINIGLSVSRIGSNAQHVNIKELVGNLKGELSQFDEYEKFSKFVTEVDQATQEILDKGRLIMKIFNQINNKPYSKSEIFLNLFITLNKIIDSNIDIKNFINQLYKHLMEEHMHLINKINQNESSNEYKEELTEVIKNFLKNKYEV